MALQVGIATLGGGYELRAIEPKAGIDFNPDAPLCQDDYEFLTSTGQYEGAGWAEERVRGRAGIFCVKCGIEYAFHSSKVSADGGLIDIMCPALCPA